MTRPARAPSDFGIRAKRLRGAAAGRRYGPPVAPPASAIDCAVRSSDAISIPNNSANPTRSIGHIILFACHQPNHDPQAAERHHQRAREAERQCQRNLRELAQEGQRCHWPPPAEVTWFRRTLRQARISLGNQLHRIAHLHALKQIFHVLIAHPDASVRCRFADGLRPVGSMNAVAFVAQAPSSGFPADSRVPLEPLFRADTR